MVNQRWP